MEGLFTHELTPEEYGKVIHHCLKQLERLGYYVDEADLEGWAPEEKDETNRLMEEDRD